MFTAVTLLKLHCMELNHHLVRGDADADGELTIADVVMLKKWLRCSGELTNWMNVDLNIDGKIDVFDLCLVKREFLNS